MKTFKQIKFELDEVNSGLGSFVSQMKKLLKDPKAKKAHKAASSLMMRAQEKGAMGKTAIKAIKKALPGLAKKAGGKWEKKIVGMKTMFIESEGSNGLELVEGKQYKIDKVFAKKGDYVFGKDSKADISVVTYKGKQVSTGYYDSGSDDWWMDHKTFKGEVAFDDAKKVVDFFAKKKIVSESVELTEIFSRAQMKKAIAIARKSDGDYSGAVKQIEKIAKGLSDEHIIKNALKKANESDEMNHIIKDALKKVETVTESEVNIEEGVSLSKKGDYEVTVDGKSSVGIRIGLRFKGKLISTGSKIKGEFVMGFKHHTPPKGDGFRLVKKGKKFTHIGFSKVDSIIAYSKKLIKERI